MMCPRLRKASYQHLVGSTLLLSLLVAVQVNSERLTNDWKRSLPIHAMPHHYGGGNSWRDWWWDQNQRRTGYRGNNTAGEEAVAEVSGGRVRGIISYLGGKNRPAHVFRGIPMSEPPVGSLRFQPLQPRSPWRPATFNATEYSAACPSNTSRTTSPQNRIGEDCIYMPAAVYAVWAVSALVSRQQISWTLQRRSTPCPVLFYIHGGGFAYDSATMFNETQIVEKYASDGVVFLIPAYRLGVLGFLDLGSDEIVKRNLGLHDIIFALKWTKKEVQAFGGDPHRITIMGNSAGGSAVEYLLVSPSVKKDDFKQAIVSSAMPYFTKNLNLVQSIAIMERLQCLNDSKTNLTLTDRQKVECLRNVSALELIGVQRELEETQGLAFTGPVTDTDLLPGENYAELLPGLKPRRLLISTTRHEMREPDQDLDTECLKAEIPLGYQSSAVHNACLNRYNSTFNSSDARISAESIHATSFLLGIVNKRKGGQTFMASFRLANHTGHADDLLFFFGLHWTPSITWTAADKLMDIYYPAMIKDFLRDAVPDRAWRPMDDDGRNFFIIDYAVSNGSIVERPHPVFGAIDDPEAINFWLTENEGLVEGRNVSGRDWPQSQGDSSESLRRKEPERWLKRSREKSVERWWRRSHTNHSTHLWKQKEEESSERNEKGDWHRESGHKPKWVPLLNRLLVVPSSGTDNNNNNNNKNTTATADIWFGEVGGDNQVAPAPVVPLSNSPSLSSAEITAYYAERLEAEYGMISEIWSAFFLSLMVAVILSIIVVMLIASNYGNKHHTNHTGLPRDGCERGDPHLSEASRILGTKAEVGTKYT